MKKYEYGAVIFDLDGVITQTSIIHFKAWKRMFDEFLLLESSKKGKPFIEFRQNIDYLTFVSGRTRYEGVKAFLESRNIQLLFGDPADDENKETICGLGNRKNKFFNELLSHEGVKTYSSTIVLIEKLRKAGIRVGVASSSLNCKAVLESAGLTHLMETVIDGVGSVKIGLKGKPEPDIFLKAASDLGVVPDRCVVVEDAASGVSAGRKGNFGLVIGVAREENRLELFENGADIVVEDLEEVSLKSINKWFTEGRKEDSWVLKYYGYNPFKEKSRETLLTIGNGYLGSRGAQEEIIAGVEHYPGTYIAGLYDRSISVVSGKEICNEDIVNIPNYLPVSYAIGGGEWFDINSVTVLWMERRLDFRTGVLTRKLKVRDENGREVFIHSERFSSMHQPHLVMMRYKIVPIDYSGKISLRFGLDGDIINAGVDRYKELNNRHIKCIQTNVDYLRQHLLVETIQSAIRIAMVANNEVFIQGESFSGVPQNEAGTASVFSKIEIECEAGQEIILEKTVGIYTSLKDNSADPYRDAMEATGSGGFDIQLELQKQAWAAIWEHVNIEIQGDRLSQKLIRLNTYHMMVSMSPHNENIDAGITARGLHGEAYRGHIFWDEIFVIPWYSMVLPKVARAMLLYRYRRLDAARKYAKENNFKGAMFPWQSGSDGREETQQIHLNPLTGDWDPDNSHLQRHVSLAIAYNIIQYVKITGDEEFMRDYGAEMILETARFWASKAIWNPETMRYDVTTIMGPDEFHEYEGTNATEAGLTNNAYTNLMLSWILSEIPDILRKAGNKVIEKTGLDEHEIAKIADISRKLTVNIDELGVIEQFAGYFNLKELDLEEYRLKYKDIRRLDRLLKSEGKRADDYKTAKQADLLMLFYNLGKGTIDDITGQLGYKLPPDYFERNLNYYMERTTHGSTLSKLVHGKLAIMAGETTTGWKMFSDAMASDYVDIQGGTTAEGIHTGVMCGTLFEMVCTFGGIEISRNQFKIRPKFPDGWEGMKFPINFRGQRYKIDIKRRRDSDYMCECVMVG